MPRIPTYLSSFEYRPPRGDVAAAGAPGRMLARFGEPAADLPAALLNFAARSSAAVGALADNVARAAEMPAANDRKTARSSAAETLTLRLKQAEAEAARADGTAQAMAELHRTVADFAADTDPATLMDRYRLRADEIGQPILEGIRDPRARARAEADYKSAAEVQGALLQRDALKRLAARGRQELADHLALYAETAAAARHPVEHDDAVDLALREIHGKADAGFLTAEDAGRLERGFHADLAERQARRAIAADPQTALENLESGEDFAALAGGTRSRLIDEAGRAVQAETVRRTTAAAAAKRDTLRRLPAYLDALRDGEPDDGRFNRDGLIATLGEEEGAARWAEIEDARAFGEGMAAIRWASPDEIARKLAAESDPDSRLHRVVERRAARLSAKPADYVLQNPSVAGLHEERRQATAQPKLPAAVTAALPAGSAPVPSDADRRTAIAAYANATLAEQERLGVPERARRVLPDSEAQDLVARILAGDPSQADQALRDLAADWGDAWPTVLDDLTRAGLPAEYTTLAEARSPAARQTIANVLAVRAKEPGTLRNKAGNDANRIDDLVARLHEEGILGMAIGPQ